MTRAHLLLLAALSACAPAVDASNAEDIRDITTRFDSAWSAHDTAAVARMMSTSYTYFSSRGDIVPRKEFLAFLAEPTYKIDFSERTEVEPRFDGNTAIVSTRWRGRGSWKEGTFVDDQRCSMVWHRAFDGWRLMSEHCTQIVSSDSAS